MGLGRTHELRGLEIRKNKNSNNSEKPREKSKNRLYRKAFKQ
jgi:hypothetical protein